MINLILYYKKCNYYNLHMKMIWCLTDPGVQKRPTHTEGIVFLLPFEHGAGECFKLQLETRNYRKHCI